MKQLSREHQAILNQKASFAHLRTVIEDEQSLELIRFYDSFDGAMSSFILTELHMRQGDRCKALQVFPDYQAHSHKQGARQNLKGLSYLAASQVFLEEFRKNLIGINPVARPPSPPREIPVEKSFSPRLQEVRQELKEAIAQLEIKGRDAQELGGVVDDVVSVFKIGASSVDVFAFISAKVKELEAVRKTPERGAETNIAVWKLVAAAVLLVLAVWVVYKCFYSPWRCSKNEKAIYNTILAVAMIVFGACE